MGGIRSDFAPRSAYRQDLCALVPCADVFPSDVFSERKGSLLCGEAYGQDQGKEKLLGYVMLSTDITDTPAYSGKPVVTLIGMDTRGHYVGVKGSQHSNPSCCWGFPESALIQFNQQYIGKSVEQKIEVGHSRPEEGVVGVDAIRGPRRDGDRPESGHAHRARRWPARWAS